jgi:hydroxymethylglutaryl-CoA reductase
MELMHKPSAKDLSQVIVAVGLADNFAALRAEGIQKGHMQLHARKESRLDVAE